MMLKTAHSMAPRSVGVSAVTGAGCEDFEKAMVDACKELYFTSAFHCGFEIRCSHQEFEESYVPFLLEQRRDLEAKRRAAVEEQAGRSCLGSATRLRDMHGACAKSVEAGWGLES